MYKALEPIWRDGKVLVCKGDDLTKKQYKALSGAQRKLCENLNGLPAINYPKGERLGEFRNDRKGAFDSLKSLKYEKKLPEFGSRSGLSSIERLESKPTEYESKSWRDTILENNPKMKVDPPKQPFKQWDSDKFLVKTKGTHDTIIGSVVDAGVNMNAHLQAAKNDHYADEDLLNSIEEDEDLSEVTKEELKKYLKEKNDVENEIIVEGEVVEKKTRRTTGRFTHSYWSPSLSPNQEYDPQR